MLISLQHQITMLCIRNQHGAAFLKKHKSTLKEKGPDLWLLEVGVGVEEGNARKVAKGTNFP